MEIGDKVQHIDDDIEGIVTSISRDSISLISSEGFEYQYPKEKLVVLGDDLETKLKSQIIPKKDKQKSKTPNKTKKYPELDLHIEKLTPTDKHLSGQAKLDLQLQEVQRFLNRLKRSHHTEAVIIHGHGKNILKNKIQKFLNEKAYVYYEASYAKYGGGALIVRLKK